MTATRRRSLALIVAVIAIAVVVAAAGQSGRESAGEITFADIAPLFDKYCRECHQPSGAGPFSLLDYASARRQARQIAAAVTRGYMPPWKAAAEDGAFVGQPRPGGAEIDLIRRWVEGGAPEGARLRPARRASAGWRLGEPDLIVSTDRPYTLPAGGGDIFRVFVIRVPISARRFVRGLEFRPGNARVVHHANIRIDRTATSRELDQADAAPGYSGLLARTALFPSGHFLGWTPGQVAPLLPKGLAWRLEPASDLVLQLHLRPTGKAESVQPSVAFFFGDDPPERTPAMLRLGRQNIDIPAGQASYVVEDSYTLPVDVELQALQPHAHYRARSVRAVATLPDGSTRPLVTIDDWDFNWQHLYRYATPFWLPRQSVISMRYVYDNSAANPRNPQQPPVRTLWGQRSAEEMGDLWVQVLTRTESDLMALNRDFRPKAILEDLVGYEALIRREPDNASLHDDAAVLYQELGRQRDAALHFAASARIRPESASAHFNLGTALTLSGDTDQAIASFERAVRIKPDYADAQNNLANALTARGRRAEAVERYRDALASDPEHVQAHNNLGRLLLEGGETVAAVRLFREALRIRPDYANARLNLGTAAAAAGDIAGAIDHYRDVLRADPEHPIARNNLGSMLLQQRELAEAAVHLQEALRLDPDYAEAHFNFARVLRAKGDLSSAIAHLRRASALKPGWEPPLTELAAIERP